MITNYYLHTTPLSARIDDLAACCDRIEDLHGAEIANIVRECGSQRLHIGLSASGWCFALHVWGEADEGSGPTTLAEWVELWSQPGARIENEYGDLVPPEHMLRMVTERTHPRGLQRHGPRRPGDGPGPGTYDLVTGEFS